VAPKPTLPPAKPADARSSVTTKKHPQLNRIDQELRNAKNTSKMVILVLAVEVDGLTDESCTISGYVLEVDKYDLKLRVVSTEEREIWFKRSAIVTVEIVK
jgi:hypothetical protein